MSAAVGIIGCGQLGQMLGQAAKRLELEVRFLRVDGETPVVQGLGEIVEDSDAAAFFHTCEYVTVEREAIPVELLQQASEHCQLRPGFAALEQLRNRHSQKSLLDRLGIPTSTWCHIETAEEFPRALAKFPADMIRCKRVLGGYDGGGQWRIDRSGGIPDLPEQAFPLIAEEELKVDREVSTLLARGSDGATVFYPVCENHMRDGILVCTLAPARLDAQTEQKMREYSQRLVNAIDYIGVMAIEFFISKGELVVNEIAPRVHNTGHWTLNAGDCDQFEQHIRAVAGLPLVAPKLTDAVAMCNILGALLPSAMPPNPVRMYVHTYGKTLRPGRKMGHATLVGPDLSAVQQAAHDIGLF